MVALASYFSLLLLQVPFVVPLPTWPSISDDVNPISRRADAFACPVFGSTFNGYKGSCTSSDVVWSGATVSGKTISFYYVSQDPSIKAAENFTVTLDAIKTAATTALATYKNWAPGINIYLGLVGAIPDADGAASAYGIAHPVKTSSGAFSRCEVLVSLPPNSSDSSILRLKKAVSHELFHCVQYGQNLAGINSGKIVTDTTDWWVEGTARFFDGIIYPIPRALRSNILQLGTFPEHYRPSITIFENNYAASLFFHYLRNIGYTLDQIDAWIARKVGQPTEALDIQDTAATSLFTSNWHGFALAFANNNLTYPTAVPITPIRPLVPVLRATEVLGIGNSRTEPISVEPFTFSAIRYTFPEGTKYSISVVSAAAFSLRPAGSAAGWKVASGQTFSFTATTTSNSVDALVSCSKARACSGLVTFSRLS